MTCPFCQKTLKHKMRTGRTCELCKRPFAFEPKDGPLFLNDGRFRKVGEKLGLDGFRFTPGQLHTVLQCKAKNSTNYAWPAGILAGASLVMFLCAKALDWETGWIFGGVFLFVGLILGAAALTSSSEPLPPPLFQAQVLDRWKAIYGSPPQGLITETVVDAPGGASLPGPGEVQAVVVCPERDLLDCLRANGIEAELKLGLLGTTGAVGPREESLLLRLQREPRLPVLLLHDASAAGVLLVRELAGLLGLQPGHRIIDLGLHARRSMEKGRLLLKVPVAAEVRTKLETTSLGEDAEGARALRRGRAKVSAAELKWLRAGNCSPILAVPPASLIKRLRLAIAKCVVKPDPAKLGFLSWPA